MGLPISLFLTFPNGMSGNVNLIDFCYTILGEYCRRLKSEKSAFCGTSFCLILAILASQKQSAAKPNISAQVRVPGDFMTLSNPY